MTRLGLALAMLLAVSVGASAQPPTLVIDQENPPQPPPVSTTFALGGPSEQVLSQIVTVGVTNDGPIVPLSGSGTDDLPFRTIMRVH